MHALREKIDHVRSLIRTHQRFLVPAMVIIGFIVDNFTLRRIDQVFDNVLLLAHLVIVGICIVVIYSRGEVVVFRWYRQSFRPWFMLLMQFSFGALFSGFLIFYLRSASFATSWIFLLFLVLLMISTEVYKQYFHSLLIQVGLYYMAWFLYLTFLIPILVKAMGAGIFIVSSLVSLIVIGLFVWTLDWIEQVKIRNILRPVMVVVVGFCITMQFLYFANIIPPIPLSLKFASVYHHVERATTTSYRATYESTPWYVFWRKRSRRVERVVGDDIYVFTAIFAPTKIDTEIIHEWQYKNPKTKAWETTNTIPLTIAGGRDDGFRTYSKKTSLREGKWRVRVKNKRGQVLGRVPFRLIEVDTIPELITEEI